MLVAAARSSRCSCQRGLKISYVNGFFFAAGRAEIEDLLCTTLLHFRGNPQWRGVTKGWTCPPPLFPEGVPGIDADPTSFPKWPSLNLPTWYGIVGFNVPLDTV